MDDDSCVTKLIEIAAVDNSRNVFESHDVRLSPCEVKVCLLFQLFTAQCYASAVLAVVSCLCSVRPSVCHKPALSQNG